ncbi:Serine protease nudel [Folsomia candida]|uniref:limulus clotting factor C n=1 Tax=Folsomia candida TaxID=158441 RepID=A0A226E7Q5_FOLCA|nr:Serine protease nudel [Folsomia candida]
MARNSGLLIKLIFLLKFSFIFCESGHPKSLASSLLEASKSINLDAQEDYQLNRTARHFSAHRHQSDCGFRCTDGACVKSHHKCDGKIKGNLYLLSAYKLLLLFKGTVHCGDASDETDCTCLDRVGSKKICDGLEDCPNGEDELGCGLGCKEDEMSCSTGRTLASHCIKISQRCDGIIDCFPTHSDEKECFRVSTLDPKTRGVVSSGILQKRIGNDWHTVCKSSGSVEHQLVKKYAKKTCDIIVGNVNEDPKIKTINAHDFEGVERLTYILKLEDKESKFNSTTSCNSGKLYHISCPEPACGWPVTKFDKHFVPTINDILHTSFTFGSDHSVHRRVVSFTIEYNVHGLTAKIVGGHDSQFGDWPFIVGIYRNGTFHCGGSILNKEWLLTAAHCTHGFEKYVFEAQVGMLRRHSFSPKEQTRFISEIHVHERYDSKIFMNDIALMKVDVPFFFSKWVTTACLSTDVSQDPLAGHECTVIGWGDLSEDGTGPDHLQEVKLPVLPKCLETFTKDNLQICAGVLEGGKDACQGDSGGPLICTNDEGRLIVSGLVSFGRGCARPDQAGVYTRVSAYTTWIENVIAGNSKLTKLPKECNAKCDRDGGECLFPKYMCDGHVNCLAAEDEMNCQFRSRASSTDDADEEAYDDIKRTAHATEEHTHEYGSAKLCGPTEFQCKTTQSCIPLELKCDGNFDCMDNTDEKHCDCGSILQNSHPHLVCDGLHHCADGSDEVDCSSRACNGTSGKIKCPLSDLCISVSKWCDASVDCPFGEDEIDCVRLMKSRGKLPDHEGFLEDKVSRGLQFGYVVTRQSGTKWGIACKEDLGNSIGESVCPTLGLIPSDPVLTRNARSMADESNAVARKKRGTSDAKCQQGKAICGEERTCGMRKLYLKANTNFPKADQTGAYPWVAMVMLEGNPICPGTLVNKQWLLASSKCIDDNVRSTSTEYLSATTGFLKTSSVVTSTMEQVKRINSVIRLSTGLSLLRLENAFTTDHFTTQICSTASLKEDGKTPSCVRVKLINGTLHDRSVTYDPACEASDHHCLRFTGDKCKRSTEYFVYCTVNQSSWFLLGYATAENVAKCTKDGKLKLENPFYGTEASETMQLLSRPVSSVIKSPGCTGTRCPVGNCVGNKFVCDGIAHCPDGLDERRCQRHYQTLLRSHDVENEDDYASYANATCPLGHFKCKMTGNCVPISAFCDGAYDCGYDDFSDEPEEHLCTCKHYLELAAPGTLCNPNGESTCPDRSDQLGCPCQPDSFVCNSRSSFPTECIHKNLVCDTIKDCSNGLDEAFCTAVSTSLEHLSMDRSKKRLEGYVLVRVKGSWHPYCTDLWSMEMGEKICKFLGYPVLLSLENYEIDELKQGRPIFEGEYESIEDNSYEKPRLWFLRNSPRFDTGPIQDVVDAKIYNSDDYNCNVGYIKCSRRS